jgi:hypothetical protein
LEMPIIGERTSINKPGSFKCLVAINEQRL